jgi:hypothetical protein
MVLRAIHCKKEKATFSVYATEESTRGNWIEELILSPQELPMQNTGGILAAILVVHQVFDRDLSCAVYGQSEVKVSSSTLVGDARERHAAIHVIWVQKYFAVAHALDAHECFGFTGPLDFIGTFLEYEYARVAVPVL